MSTCSSRQGRLALGLLVASLWAGAAHAAPPAAFRNALSTSANDLVAAANRFGVTLSGAKASVLLRNDVYMITAPTPALSSVALTDLAAQPGTRTFVGGSYLCAPCDVPTVPPSGIPGRYYGMVLVHDGTFDAATGLPSLDLVLTGSGGTQITFDQGGLLWTDDAAPVDPSLTKIDLSAHGDDVYDPLSRTITVTIWIQIDRWRGCWSKTIVL